MEYLKYSLGFFHFKWNTRNFPATFNGEHVKTESCNQATPCFGERCGGPRNGLHWWHPKGTPMLRFRDATVKGDPQWHERYLLMPPSRQRQIAFGGS